MGLSYKFVKHLRFIFFDLHGFILSSLMQVLYIDNMKILTCKFVNFSCSQLVLDRPMLKRN
jgi:hypothetical protein